MCVTLTDLPALVRQLTAHISPDDTLPTLNGIYLEATGTHLFAFATDRYTFALTRREAPETIAPWRVLIARTDLTALKALFAGLGLQMPIRFDEQPTKPARDRHDRTALRTTWTDTLTVGRHWRCRRPDTLHADVHRS